MTEEKRLAAIVTGATSGIGLAISQALIESGYQVFGIGRDFTRPDFQKWYKTVPENTFRSIELDLAKTDALAPIIKYIQAQADVRLLVNNAGCAYYGLHEEVSPAKISEMVRVNLEVPMILTQLLLRQFKQNKGCIVNISSVTASSVNPHGCAYGATKAGLSGFSRSLFEEARKYGVRVVTISPDMTDTRLYRNADFETDVDREAYLDPQDVANAVLFALQQPDHVDVGELTLRPQKHRIARKNRL